MAALLLLVVGALAVVAAQGPTCTVDSTIGCFQDFIDGGARVLDETATDLNDNDYDSCAAFCYRFGFAYSGVEYRTQCFCGNAIINATPAPMQDCFQLPCPGNVQQGCGDANRILIFKTNCTGVRRPNFHGCVEPEAKALKYCDTSLTHLERVNDLLSHLTLDEKIAAISPQPNLGDTCADHTSGVPRIGLPNWSWLVETNTAVAAACIGNELCATTFSGPMGMGASFNETSWYLKGAVIGNEMRAFHNVQWHRGNTGDYVGFTGYGPNINIARDPRFGRNSELPGEDPFLNGMYAKNMVNGMQEKDDKGYPRMLAYLKHFTAYSTETNRGHDTYNISTHDLYESYLAQYKIAFTQAGATGAMCSYNAINGHPSCANDLILNKVLREEWNQPMAHITTDCGAVRNLRGPPVNAPDDATAAAMAINNGTDIEMGSTLFTYSLKQAEQQNLTSEAAIDAAFRRSYYHHFVAGRFDPVEQVSWTQIGVEVINSTEHRQIQFEAALQSLVLLKNSGNALPLKTGIDVAVLGPMGETREGLLSDYAGDQQCFNDYDCIPTIAEAIRAVNKGGNTTDAAGVDVNSQDTSRIPAAVRLASEADVVVLVLGIDKSIEHEGLDRTDTALPGQQENFAKQVLAVGKPTVLVLCNGGALAIDNLVAGPAAIVEAFNPSVKGPPAIAETLFGFHNRWGKLPVTMYPHDYIKEQPMINYDMAKAPGRTYRYYTGKPLWPFGYGLSYTKFQLHCTAEIRDVVCKVTNVGQRDGDEVLFLFHAAGHGIRSKVNHPVPIKSLIGFKRVSLPAGASTLVEFEVGDEQLMLVNAEGQEELYPGQHVITVTNGVDLFASFDVHVEDATGGQISFV